jgi:S-formylglutathione hydrolase FrmB
MSNAWQRIEIAGHPADVFVPPDAGPYAVLFLHPVGGEMPSANAAYTAAFSRHGLAVVAPRGGTGWWADRICPDFDATLTPQQHVLQNVLPWAAANLKPVRAAAGISMGGQGAIRLAFRFPHLFPVAGSVAGAFDYHDWHGRGTLLDAMYPTREACRQDTAILHLNPQQFPAHLWFACDPDDADWYRGNDRLAEKLRAYGVPHTADLETEAGGHTWPYFDAMAEPLCAFLTDGLRQAGRRLL